jgi:GcrA cell cycle regulator
VWSDERKAELRWLWHLRADGKYLSVTEIGARMGLTRGQVMGQVYRMKLVREDVAPKAEKARPVLVLSTPESVAESWFEKTFKPDEPKMTKIEPAPESFGALRVRRGELCCFPLGTPGKRDFRFCDEPTVPGKPYCGTHAAVAYVAVRPYMAEAAYE